MLNVVLPMAGAGRRFAEAGYDRPKPFIDVLGRPMIERVLENLYFEGVQYLLVAQQAHVVQFADVFARLVATYPVQVFQVAAVTEGAACTVLHAVRAINNDTPLLIANSDQLLDISLADFVQASDERGLAGSLLTFSATGTQWSYAAVNDAGLVTAVAEKRPISHHATAGMYYFRRGQDFVHAAVEMIVHNDRVNNEFYVAPTYNYAIKHGAHIGIYDMAPAAMHALGTPEDLNAYLAQQAAPVAHIA